MTFLVQALELFATPETTLRHLKRSKHPLEATYAGMLRRCYNPNEPLYHRYGGRGITVCERWKLPYGRGFANFVEDMGAKPEGTSLDRTDNNGHYDPANCRWTDRKTQNRNRNISSYVIFNGEKIFLGDLAKANNIDRRTIYARMKRGLTIEQAISHKLFARIIRKKKEGS